LQGREPDSLEDFNNQLRQWVWNVANQRLHGTTHERVMARWEADQMNLQPLHGRAPYPFAEEQLRKVARDAFVSWQGSRYSVPWIYAGKEVWVREGEGRVEVHYGAQGVPLGARPDRKTLVHIRQSAPVVDHRHGDPPVAASLDDGQHSRRELPVERPSASGSSAQAGGSATGDPGGCFYC
jgi:hypothetical protein